VLLHQVKAVTRRSDCRVNVSRIATLNLVEDLAVRRVNNVDGFPEEEGTDALAM